MSFHNDLLLGWWVYVLSWWLLQKGADPDIKDKNGNTALSLAVQAKQDR